MTEMKEKCLALQPAVWRLVGNAEVGIAPRYGTLASWLSDKWSAINSVHHVKFHAITRRDGPLLRFLVACSRLV
jgi:hypothetical protein